MLHSGTIHVGSNKCDSVPVFVRCDATPLSTAALRNFSSPAIALNLGRQHGAFKKYSKLQDCSLSESRNSVSGNDHPTGLVHIAGEGRQFLHVVDLNESDLL